MTNYVKKNVNLLNQSIPGLSFSEYAVGMLYQGINATNKFTSRLISNVISTDTAKCISFEYMKVTTITVTRNDTDGTESTLFQDNVRTPHPTWVTHTPHSHAVSKPGSFESN